MLSEQCEITATTPYDQLPDQLTPDEFCAFTRQSRATVYRHVQAGMLPVVRYGRQIRILKRVLRDGTEAR